MITDLGILRPDPDSSELELAACYRGVEPDQVRANVGWDLRISAGLGEVPPPSETELTALRDLLARTKEATGD